MLTLLKLALFKLACNTSKTLEHDQLCMPWNPQEAPADGATDVMPNLLRIASTSALVHLVLSDNEACLSASVTAIKSERPTDFKYMFTSAL